MAKRYSDTMDVLRDKFTEFRDARPHGLTKADLDFTLDPGEIQRDYSPWSKTVKLRRWSHNKCSVITTNICTDATPWIFYRVYRDMPDEIRNRLEDTYSWRRENINAKWLWEQGGSMLELSDLEGLSLSQKAAFSFAVISSGNFANQAEYQPQLNYLKKMNLSAWHWGFSGYNWQSVVKAHRFIQAFEFGEDFEVFLNMTRGDQERGSSKYYPQGGYTTWLDAPFSFHVCYKGAHVLTIGFSVSGRGISIHQVQMKNKKGNRWIFKLGMNLMDYVTRQARRAAAGLNLNIWLVSGNSIADYIYHLKPEEDQQSSEWEETRKRIVGFYDQDLVNFERIRPVLSRGGVVFHRLVKKRMTSEPIPQVLAKAA